MSYAKDCGLRELPLMARVIQRFLEATRSGVMFTSFLGPDGRTRILVEHVEGTCEKLVTGQVTPNRLWMLAGSAIGSQDTGALAPEHAAELARLATSI